MVTRQILLMLKIKEVTSNGYAISFTQTDHVFLYSVTYSGFRRHVFRKKRRNNIALEGIMVMGGFTAYILSIKCNQNKADSGCLS